MHAHDSLKVSIWEAFVLAALSRCDHGEVNEAEGGEVKGSCHEGDEGKKGVSFFE